MSSTILVFKSLCLEISYRSLADIIEALSVALLNELEQRMKKWPAISDIGSLLPFSVTSCFFLISVHLGDSFKRMAPMLRCYSSYIRHYNRSQNYLKEYKEGLPKFAGGFP
jgi:hypothetical protein